MTPVTPEDKERFMPLLASPLGGFMPLLIIFIVLIGFTLWQGKRQVKKTAGGARSTRVTS